MLFKGSGYATSSITVNGLPSIQTISPVEGSTNGGLVLTLNGNGFTSATSVSIGGSACNVTQATLGVLTCTTSSNTVGTKTFTIR